MTLHDAIIDEAEQLSLSHVLCTNPYDAEIVEAISEIVGVPLHVNSIGARLAVAAYRRYEVVSTLERNYAT